MHTLGIVSIPAELNAFHGYSMHPTGIHYISQDSMHLLYSELCALGMLDLVFYMNHHAP